MKYKFSVIIPAHNEEKTISNLLNSLISQIKKRRDSEIIVVNDGSTDDTRKIVESFIRECKFIKLINLGKGHSAAFARNRGVEKAKGHYLVFLDADEVAPSNFIEKISKHIPFERLLIKTKSYMPETIFQKGWSAYRLYWNTQIERNKARTHSKIFKYDIFKKYKFNESMFYFEDIDINNRMDLDNVAYKKSDVTIYHIDPKTLSDFIRQRKWQGKSFMSRKFYDKLRYFFPCFFPPIMIYLFFKYWITIKNLKLSLIWSCIDLIGRYVSLFEFFKLKIKS